MTKAGETEVRQKTRADTPAMPTLAVSARSERPMVNTEARTNPMATGAIDARMAAGHRDSRTRVPSRMAASEMTAVGRMISCSQ
jgi:hypothetical protein